MNGELKAAHKAAFTTTAHLCLYVSKITGKRQKVSVSGFSRAQRPGKACKNQYAKQGEELNGCRKLLTISGMNTKAEFQPSKDNPGQHLLH